jgi:transposase
VPRTRPSYPEEFRREAVKLALLGDKPQRTLAKDLGISDVTLRKWVKQEKADRGERPDRLSSGEREELARLREENARLRMEREILAAAVFFAKESDGAVGEVFSFIAADKANYPARRPVRLIALDNAHYVVLPANAALFGAESSGHGAIRNQSTC